MESKTPVSEITVVDVARLKRRGLAEDDKMPKKVCVELNYLFIIACLFICADCRLIHSALQSLWYVF